MDWIREEDVNEIMNLIYKTIWEKGKLERLGKLLLNFSKETKKNLKFTIRLSYSK